MDTIFVSCAPGVGADDTSGVIAGLQEDVKAAADTHALALLWLQVVAGG